MKSQQSIFIICGVSGVGKSTIGRLLSEKLGFMFYEGDDYHPASNIDKMAAGHPLEDHDRADWLHNLNQTMRQNKHNMVISCSALKESYRKILRDQVSCDISWIFLVGSYELIDHRMSMRSAHFMPASLLRSQFDILDIPQYAQTYNVSLTPNDIIEMIKTQHEK